MKKCFRCGTELDDKAMFCIECGAPQPTQETKCIQCGAKLQPGAKFCTECGAKQIVKKLFCANCGTELKDGMKFCVECGMPTLNNSTTILPSEKSSIIEKEEVLNPLVVIEDSSEDNACNYKADEDEDGFYGFVDDDGEWVIEPKFDEAEDFCGGFAVVKEDDKYGYIKSDGSYLVEPTFDEAYDFCEGLALVCIDDEWGYIKQDGTYLIEPKFEDANSFCNGLAPVCIDDEWGYIKQDGSYLIKPKFSTASIFCEGVALVSEGLNSYGYIKPDGSYLIKPKFDYAYDFCEGLACVRRNWKYGYIKKDGSYLVELNLESANSFSEGYGCVKIDGKYGYIKHDGTYFIEPVFVSAKSFKDGKADIAIIDEKKRAQSIWKYGKLYIDGTIKFDDGEMTDIDKLTNKTTKPQNNEGKKDNQRHKVYKDDDDIIDDDDDTDCDEYSSGEEKNERNSHRLMPFMDPDDGKWGYKDQYGNIALLADFEEADDFIGDYARVVLCGNVLYIDKEGHLCEDRAGNEVVIPTYSDNNDDDNYEYNNDYSYDDSDDYKPKKSFSRKLVGAVVKGLKNAASSPSSSSTRTTSRNIRKVWRCTYIGTINDAPRVLDVPSENSTGRPSGSEFVAALKAMGYEDSKAHAIAAGGGNHAWECK